MQVEINDQIINVVVEKKKQKNMYFSISYISTLNINYHYLSPSS